MINEKKILTFTSLLIYELHLLDFSGPSIMVKLVNESPLFAMDQEFMNLFYNKKPTDCILYSEDGIPFKVHKEILSQTELMQNILTSAKESSASNQFGLESLHEFGMGFHLQSKE